MLAVYGLPLGLLLSGPLVEWRTGFSATGSFYSLLGLSSPSPSPCLWRTDLWIVQRL